jgi:molybdopterin-guanine dinucleotide biosynthesis protein A
MTGGILGLVLAGGGSTRFGSDKALAVFDGRSLLEHARATVGQWCGEVVVVGRDDAPVPCLPDWPGPGLGPLGGLAAGLRHARASGYEAVLVLGVDSPGLPLDLLEMLQPGPAYVESQPVIGLWPVSVLAAVEGLLKGDGRRSMYALAKETGARGVVLDASPANINTQSDLASLSGKSAD